MIILKQEIPMDCNIFNFGDLHIGSVMFYEKGFNKLVKLMSTSIDGLDPDKNLGIDHGDTIEAVTLNDPRFDLETTKEFSILAQADHYIKLLQPIKSKIITILEGNHPRKLWRFGHMTEYICKRLGVKFGTWTAKINYVDTNGKPLFKQLAAHGYGSINSRVSEHKRRKVNQLISLRRQLEQKASDCVVMSMGHTHKLLVNEPDSCLYLYDNGETLEQGYTGDLGIKQTSRYIPGDFRWYLNTGTFRRCYVEGISDYGEMAGYDPLELGFTIVKVRGGKVVKVEKVLI